MSFDQIGIALTGVTAVWLTQDSRESWRRWACIFGIIGQPFWFYATWKAEQWGIFALCTLYAYSWGRGVWRHWLRPAPPISELRATTCLGVNGHRPSNTGAICSR